MPHLFLQVLDNLVHIHICLVCLYSSDNGPLSLLNLHAFQSFGRPIQIDWCKPYRSDVSDPLLQLSRLWSLSSSGTSLPKRQCPVGPSTCSFCEAMPTLRSGRAGRPTKGALRGADARVTGTACWALASGLRMDIAGAAMVSLCMPIRGCTGAR